MASAPAKPFLKWAGGKYRLLPRILPELPEGKRFVEPFAGSCAVYLNVSCKAALIADLNPDLVGLYRQVQSEGESFIRYCQSFFTAAANTREAYLRLRERFNASLDVRERGALLLYLNRHGYNGLVRYNARRQFNVPFGQYKKPYFPLAELRRFHDRTRACATRFEAVDFRAVFADVRAGDVVYCDPPYVPLTSTAHFTAYAGNGFSARDQADLARLAADAGRKGACVVLSNHDTPLTRALYADADLRAFSVRRFISCRGTRRGAAPELLAVYRRPESKPD